MLIVQTGCDYSGGTILKGLTLWHKALGVLSIEEGRWCPNMI